MSPFESVRITSPAFKADPHQFYARLRSEAPVCRVRLPGGEAHLVARYHDVSALLKDARLVKNPANALAPGERTRERQPPRMLAPLTRNMLGTDDPDHARLKRLVQVAFTPRRVMALTSRTQAISEALLDRLAGRSRFDIVRDYAMELPVTVISDLLGVPQPDRRRFARWSATLTKVTGSRIDMALALPGLFAFVRYLRQLIEAKRARPGDDLVSALLEDQASDRLDADELLAMAAILLTAGHETTTNLIGSSMLALIQHQDARDQLRADPGIVEPAVEELLRFTGPVELSTTRYAREDIEIAGSVIPRGAKVFGIIASANRDEQVFTDPHRLDLRRTPNRHLSFGEGGHYCVGAALARMEGQVAIAGLLGRYPALQLDCPLERITWRRGLVMRGLEMLPVRVGRPDVTSQLR